MRFALSEAASAVAKDHVPSCGALSSQLGEGLRPRFCREFCFVQVWGTSIACCFPAGARVGGTRARNNRQRRQRDAGDEKQSQDGLAMAGGDASREWHWPERARQV